MGTLTGWLAILALAGGTFLLRHAFIGLLHGRTLPPTVARAVQLAVPAILAALVVPLVLMPAPDALPASRLPHVLAALVAGVWAFRRGGMLLPMAVGFAVLHAAKWLL
jgi:branched-subunit amino acid transport protein